LTEGARGEGDDEDQTTEKPREGREERVLDGGKSGKRREGKEREENRSEGMKRD
jgi:hypothetical protein